MKIKQYVVTYNNPHLLERHLSSIFRTRYEDREVYVINNHTNFVLPEIYEGKVKVLHNILSPDFATGHLSRNWNQAILNGIKDLDKPDCDILITSQDDSVFKRGYIHKVLENHLLYNFIQYGSGDECISYTPCAIKQIGLWDERFCNTGYQEADYLLRAYLYYRDCSSINDEFHGRIHNKIGSIIERVPNGFEREEIYSIESRKHHGHSYNMFLLKWDMIPHAWDKEQMKDIKPLIDSYIYYPYFEYKIETLKEQRYATFL